MLIFARYYDGDHYFVGEGVNPIQAWENLQANAEEMLSVEEIDISRVSFWQADNLHKVMLRKTIEVIGG